jgi:hypothetical protein
MNHSRQLPKRAKSQEPGPKRITSISGIVVQWAEEDVEEEGDIVGQDEKASA